MKRLLPALLLLALVACGPTGDGKKSSDDEVKSTKVFRDLNLEDALKAARDEKKVVFIDFHALWCGPCRMLDERTFRAPLVKTFLEQKTIPIKVNIDEAPALAAKYDAGTIPLLVFLSAEGKEIGRLRGFRDAETFLDEAVQIVKK